MFQNERTVFEIPIYSMKETEFNKKWNKKKKSFINHSLKVGNSEGQAEKLFENIYYPQYVWKYNQIVGYVEIKVAQRDIVLNVQKILDTRIVVTSKRKHFIRNMWSNGKHFSISGKRNEEIVCEIDRQLCLIDSELSKSMCLFLDTYNNVKNRIDFVGIKNDILQSLND